MEGALSTDRTRHRTRYAGVRYRLTGNARRYIVGYVDANGRYHTETLPAGSSLEDARDRKAELEGKKRTLVVTRMTVGELLDGYLDSRRSSLRGTTIENYEYGVAKVKDHVGQRQLKSLSASDCARMIQAWKDAGHKAWTIKKLLTPLVGALRVAVREGWIQSSQIDALLPHERPKADQKTMRVLSGDEIEALLKAASSDRWRCLFALLAFTGLRISEALALRWEDIDTTGGYLTVRESKTEAGKRNVMLIPRLSSMLTRHRLAQSPGTEFVFANKRGTPVARREALRGLRASEKRAEIPDYTLHELRHTFASILIAQGESPALIADQMGHSNPKVTFETYAHLFDAQKNVEAARERLQAAFGGMV